MWDIYGQPLKRGHCEVHSWINEEYPCSLCMSEKKQKDMEEKQSEQYYEAQRLQNIIEQLQAHIKSLEAVREWADINLSEMECRGDEDCDHCEGIRRVKACEAQATEGENAV